jgi:hypothetical protein
MDARIHQGEIILDANTSRTLRQRYGINAQLPSSSSSEERGASVDLKKVEFLLETLLNSIVSSNRQTQQAILDLENTVGNPIRRAVEKSSTTRRRK